MANAQAGGNIPIDVPRRIFVDAGCSETERLAARELQVHLKFFGENPRVVEVDRGEIEYDESVCLGAAFLPSDATDALSHVRDDGFLLYKRNDTIHIAAAMPRGILFGCYQYLESLGVRWPEPGQSAELIHRRFELPAGPSTGVDNPDFRTRGNNCYCPTNARDLQTTIEMIEWLIRQRCNLHSLLRADTPTLTGFNEFWYSAAEFVHQRGCEFALGSHLTWPGLLMYEDREMFKKHPEYFPLRGGKRQQTGPFGAPTCYGPDAIGSTGSGMSLCISNPKVAELVVRNLQSFLDEHPEIDVMGLWPPDTKWEGCECTKCRDLVQPDRMWSNIPHHTNQWRATSDHLVHFIGRVSAGIKKSHPKVRVLSWGWCTTEPAPQNATPEGRFQFDQFLVPCYAHPLDSESCLNHHIQPKALKKWAKTKNVDLGWIFAGAGFTAVMAEYPFAWLIKRNVEFIRQIGGKAVTTCHEIGEAADQSVRGDMTDHYTFSACGVNYFTMGRLGWKSATPLEELYRDFAEARFGQAAGGLIADYYGQIVERYDAWEHSQPTSDFYDVWGGSEMRCRPCWEVPLDLLTEEIIFRSRELLEKALRRARRKLHKQRVQSERNVFEHTVRLREIFKIHQARQKLEDAGLTDDSQKLRRTQRRILAAAKCIELPKQHGETMIAGDETWIEMMWM